MTPDEWYRVGHIIWSRIGGYNGDMQALLEDIGGNVMHNWDSWALNQLPFELSQKYLEQLDIDDDAAYMMLSEIVDDAFEAEFGTSLSEYIG